MPSARVLLIEDNPIDSMLIKALLSKAVGASFDVETTESLSAALAMIARGSFDVILSDLTLPDSSGLDTFTSVFRAAGCKGRKTTPGCWTTSTAGCTPN